MTGVASVLGSLQSVDGVGIVRIEDRLDAGIEDVWASLTEPGRLAAWFGEIEGELSEGSDFRVRITLSGPRTGHVDACQPRGTWLGRFAIPIAGQGSRSRWRSTSG